MADLIATMCQVEKNLSCSCLLSMEAPVDKRLKNAIWNVTQTRSDFHLRELRRDVQS